eukprot:3941923-Rhodomonas_salina.5
MSGTGVAAAATGLRARYAMSGTEICYATPPAYARATRCPVLTCAVLPAAPDTDLAYGVLSAYRSPMHFRPEAGSFHPSTLPAYARATRCPVLTSRNVLSGRESMFQSKRQVSSAIYLRACYAMSGTDVAYGATSLKPAPLGALLRT